MKNTFAMTYIKPFMTHGSLRMIHNVKTNTNIINCQNIAIPTTCNDKQYHSSYVVSPYNALVDYSFEEVNKIDSKLLRHILKMLISFQALFLKAGKINQNVMLNNYLLSTNLYHDISYDAFKTITQETIKFYKNHALCWRSLNLHSNQKIINDLKRLGYLMIPSRQVYIFDKSLCDYTKKNNY